jgi:mRNA interferase RelE/StbE
MSADRAYAITWTATALKPAQAIPDQRIRPLISQRADQLGTSPEEQGKPLVGELAGFRSIRAVGQRYRIVYRVERREVTVLIVAVSRRRSGDKSDVYELARKLLRQRLLR